MHQKLFLETLKKHTTTRAPFWFMRQAGRYLPEYREIRATRKNFWDLCFTPELAARVTLQPIERFHMDAAILFSDILVVPYALGQRVVFEEGEGPKLEPITSQDAIGALSLSEEKIAPVMQTVKLVASQLPKDVALIGFAGSPWTVSCYMAEGKGSREFQTARKLAAREPALFDALIHTVTEATIHYLSAQVRAGAEAIQLFDSWAGVAPVHEYERYVIAPTKRIVAALKQQFPTLPIIGFPKGGGVMIEAYVKHTGVDAVSVDFSIPPTWAATHLQPHVAVQGNLDPICLAEDLPRALAEAKAITSALRGGPFIFNLGHGMVPHTPVAHVQALCEYLKNP